MWWYLEALKKYFVFYDRARRKEFWFFCLFALTLLVVFITVEFLLPTMTFIPNEASPYILLAMLAIYFFIVIVPGFSLLVRRLHDINKAHYWMFINFVPMIGPICLLVLLCTPGSVGPNDYGDDPKEEYMADSNDIDGVETESE